MVKEVKSFPEGETKFSKQSRGQNQLAVRESNPIKQWKHVKVVEVDQIGKNDAVDMSDPLYYKKLIGTRIEMSFKNYGDHCDGSN